MTARAVLRRLSAPLFRMRHAIRKTSEQLRAGLGLSLLRGTSAASRARAIDALLATPVTTQTKYGPIRFLNHSTGSQKRAERLLLKEPDSLKWIDAMLPGSVFWDIGANIGTLSLYAAARGDLDVWAFEPAAVNYYNLTANCELNGFTDRMRCLQLGFGEVNVLATLNVSQLMPAQSFSFADKDHPFPVSQQTAILCTVDDFIARYGAPCPNYIKIDVPGLTQAILAGAKETLGRPELKQIQVETNEQSKGGRQINAALAAFGFEVVARNMKRRGTVQGDLVYGRVSA